MQSTALPFFRAVRIAVMGAGLAAFAALSPAQAPASPALAASSAGEARHTEFGISDWLLRMHEASRRRAYIGTYVVTAGANMSSARIWHVCDGDLQVERVETLSGAPRSTFRRNDQVVTFFADSKTAIAERRESLGLFPNLLKATDSLIEQFYSARQTGVDRVAGFETDVVMLLPKDSLRFGYRVWSEKKSGLVVKLQTLDVDGRVLEQAAFSELQLDAPVNMGKLTQMMENTEGYRVEKPEMLKTTAAAEGWNLKTQVTGFRAMSCYKRPAATSRGSGADNTMQWIFSDGLASVSLFLEVYDQRRHVHQGSVAVGATNTLTRRISDKTGDWWLTAVGEVPQQTLVSFSMGLERKK